jgi:DNA-binding NarL/FixJ family response regulator
MLTLYDEAQHVNDAIKAGAKGYVLKKVRRDELVRIIHDVFEDRAFLDPEVTEAVFNKIKRKDTLLKGEINIELTQRELEILKYLVDGYKDRQIAESLFISEHTVRSHIKNIYKKFRVTSRSQAVVEAVRKGIINA